MVCEYHRVQCGGGGSKIEWFVNITGYSVEEEAVKLSGL